MGHQPYKGVSAPQDAAPKKNKKIFFRSPRMKDKTN